MRRNRGRHHRSSRTPGEVAIARFPFGLRDSHRGGRRRARIFDNGDLRFLILQLIANSPLHGYEIIKTIEDKLGGSYSPSPGVIYPTLAMLEDLGFAALSSTEGSKKLYALTREGAAYLEANTSSVEAISARIAASRSVRGADPPPPMLRAMENLRMALSLRIARDGLTEREVRTIVAAIDAAAVAVERS